MFTETVTVQVVWEGEALRCTEQALPSFQFGSAGASPSQILTASGYPFVLDLNGDLIHRSEEFYGTTRKGVYLSIGASGI